MITCDYMLLDFITCHQIQIYVNQWYYMKKKVCRIEIFLYHAGRYIQTRIVKGNLYTWWLRGNDGLMIPFYIHSEFNNFLKHSPCIGLIKSSFGK